MRPSAAAPAALVPLALAFVMATAAGCERRVPNGRLAPHAPGQENYATPQPPVRMRDCDVTPLARYRCTGRVLHTMRYDHDRGAKLAPVDLALGWGPMSDNQVLEDLKIGQMYRFYTWSGRELPLEPEQITANSANVHMMPATDAVRRVLLRVRRNDGVTFSGQLVQVAGDDGWTWVSSMTRDDTGNGACELVLVDSLSVR